MLALTFSCGMSNKMNTLQLIDSRHHALHASYLCFSVNLNTGFTAALSVHDIFGFDRTLTLLARQPSVLCCLITIFLALEVRYL
jgi:hypothetical protein